MSLSEPLPAVSVSQATPAEVPCVFFKSGHQRWGARLNDLRKILAPPPATVVPIPNSPAWLRGVFHVEIEIATLIDLAGFLDPQTPSPASRPRDQAVLIVEHPDGLFGLLVTQVSQVVLLPAADVSPVAPPATPLPYLLATYAPLGAADADAVGTSGLLAITEIVQACVAALDARGAL